MLRRCHKLLLRCLGTERGGIQAVDCAAASAKTRHRLHQLSGRAGHLIARSGRRVDGEAADLLIAPDLAKTAGAAQRIIGNVVNLKRAGPEVAQHHVAVAGATDRAEACDEPFLADSSDGVCLCVPKTWSLLIA